MADSRPLIAKIQVEHSGAAKGGRTSTSTEEQNTKVNKAIHSSSEENTQENKKSNLFLEKLHKVGKFQLLRFLGINLALHTLVKQSAVYTSVLGALFQMLGALIDMILAPLLPMLIPFLRSFAQNLPGIAAKITSVLEWIGGKFVDFYNFSIRVWPFMEKIWNFLGGTLKYWIVGLIIARMGGFHTTFIQWTGQLLAMIALNFGKLLAFLAKNSIGRMLPRLFGRGKDGKVAGPPMTIATKVAYINALAMGAGGKGPPGGIGPVLANTTRQAGSMAALRGLLTNPWVIAAIVAAGAVAVGIMATKNTIQKIEDRQAHRYDVLVNDTDENGNQISDRAPRHRIQRKNDAETELVQKLWAQDFN